MWYAPTAADWAKPCAIRWQRSWDDAVRLSQQTKKPILVCVNMDGEIASEHYAGVRYRDPEIAKLWEPYVCVIASVYRHTPRDHDDDGEQAEVLQRSQHRVAAAAADAEHRDQQDHRHHREILRDVDAEGHVSDRAARHQTVNGSANRPEARCQSRVQKPRRAIERGKPRLVRRHVQPVQEALRRGLGGRELGARGAGDLLVHRVNLLSDQDYSTVTLAPPLRVVVARVVGP